MHLERYDFFRSPTYKEYEFYSEGHKGRIRKVVQFYFVPASRVPFYNLGFGDWNETDNKIDDKSITNNGDAEKVLATVASIVLDFTAFFDEAMVFAQGVPLPGQGVTRWASINFGMK